MQPMHHRADRPLRGLLQANIVAAEYGRWRKVLVHLLAGGGLFLVLLVVRPALLPESARHQVAFAWLVLMAVSVVVGWREWVWYRRFESFSREVVPSGDDSTPR